MLFLNWRHVYVATFGLRFFFALSNSYIHPDEHFQSFEPLAGLVFGFSTDLPWEFRLADPARSIAPLLVVYYPLMQLASWIQLSPMQTFYLVRLAVMLVSWMATDWFLYKMLPTKLERIKAIFFVLTSYVSIVYQSHTFSNSVETVLVLAVVYLINELRFLRSVPSNQFSLNEIAYIGVLIGAISAFGVFNRVTFPVFIVFPALFLVPAILQWKRLVPCLLIGFCFSSAVCIVVDTSFYHLIPVWETLRHVWQRPFLSYVIAPLNNLMYNSRIENLSNHGIHPRYTHVAINLPQLLGPGLIFLFGRGRNMYWKTTPFFSAMGGILFLSIIPHQELRFLVPAVPLLCACFDLTVFERFVKRNISLVSLTLKFWLVFNVLMAIVMGVFHQGGVIPAVNYFHTSHSIQASPYTIVWWRTYLPPTWMLGDTLNTTQFVLINDEHAKFEVDSAKRNHNINAMGMLWANLQLVLEVFGKHAKEIYVVTPIASFEQCFENSGYEKVWNYLYHMDMDHLDFTDLSSSKPGLGIYRKIQ